MILGILISALLAFAGALFLPWWGVLIGPLVYGFFAPKLKAGQAAFVGFTAIGLLWSLLMVMKSLPNDFTAANRFAELLGLGSPVVLILVTAVLGGILGGLSGLSGRLLANVLR